MTGFAILEELGRGGMGVVYRARQKRLGRTVALKMLLAGARASPDLLDRLRNEAETVARCSTPTWCRSSRSRSTTAFRAWCWSTWTVEHWPRRWTAHLRPLKEVARLIETLARTIHQAHLRGIVHRDLKPANVLLTADDIPKITDFGLAKLLVDGASLTATGETLGTPSYIAPEQVDGSSPAGPPADVYGLGTILYELLTGRPPFRGESTQETIRQVMFDEPVAPSRLRPQLPRDLETICLKCLEKEPRRRYQLGRASCADECWRFLAGEPIQARPVGARPAGSGDGAGATQRLRA